MKLRVLDLFSGIGGFSLGLERATHDGPYTGFETVAFCEISEYPRKVLAKHWPGVPIYDDVTTLTAERLSADGITVDVITGGFPCQDISVAGRRAGIAEGTRSGLWSECIRLVSELRPQYALFENVANLLAGPSNKPGGWFSRVLSDLAGVGYDAEWENIPASALGAPHRRERIWLLAHPAQERHAGEILCKDRAKSNHVFPRASLLPPYSNGMVMADGDYSLRGGDGFPAFMGELNGYGNAVVPQIPELIGRAILEAA